MMSEQVEPLVQRARELTETGRQDDAIQLLLQALQLDAKNETIMIMLGGAYFAEQKFSEAEMIFERLIIMQPGRGEYSIALFNTLWQQGRQEEALEEIKRFLQQANQETEQATIRQYMDIIREFQA